MGQRVYQTPLHPYIGSQEHGCDLRSRPQFLMVSKTLRFCALKNQSLAKTAQAQSPSSSKWLHSKCTGTVAKGLATWFSPLENRLRRHKFQFSLRSQELSRPGNCEVVLPWWRKASKALSIFGVEEAENLSRKVRHRIAGC